MGIIYILRKEVAGLGQLTKIGMTTRGGEDRASEYGGGGWEVVEAIEVSLKDDGELRDIEGRIHARLEAHRCHAAAGLGLVEVFTCTPDAAVSAAHAEIGTQATDSSRVDLLRKRTNQAIERKIIQSHASDLVKLHLGRWPTDESRWHDFASDDDAALWDIHKTALSALDRIGAEASTFREMVKADLSQVDERRAAALKLAEDNHKREEIRHQQEEQERARQKVLKEEERATELVRHDALNRQSQEQEATKRRLLAERESRERMELRSKLREFNQQMEERLKTSKNWLRLSTAAAIVAAFSLVTALIVWETQIEVAVVCSLLVIIALYAAFIGTKRYGRESENIRTMLRDWNDAHSGD